ncbi:HEAT repeat domain-containing protein [Georgenia satyanarayanai]|uniref:HEAT repeat domain-containing protein n=1 Tax=Georgenia satyanarayanai TaxID=860221 RepID=UPI002040A05D|nr:HEAT repeat domain-containing protein [Georgenia satyanarayanai]MCM3662461.1 HEAT repeat domain-containing protein [Georgenia satyanarayanai]
MDTTRHDMGSWPADALAHPDSSTRLRAALAAGTRPDPALVTALVHRCRTEPDFFVRDMLTWALTRHPAAATVPLLLTELRSTHSQARSQALHTLSKIGDHGVWPAIRAAVHDPDDEAARSAWRAAVVLVPPGEESGLARELVRELGRGGHDTQRSLSRALVALGDAVAPAVEEATASSDPRVRAHAVATEALRRDPDSGFALAEATRVVLTGAAPTVPDEPC